MQPATSCTFFQECDLLSVEQVETANKGTGINKSSLKAGGLRGNPRWVILKKLETEAVDFREAVTRGKRGVKGKEKAGGRSRG